MTREEALKRLPVCATDWFYPSDDILPAFEALVVEGIANQRGMGFQMKAPAGEVAAKGKNDAG